MTFYVRIGINYEIFQGIEHLTERAFFFFITQGLFRLKTIRYLILQFRRTSITH